MNIEIASQDDRMAPSGSAILRSLQNQSLPVVDLVIRESFQNSLDAGLSDKNFVNINVNVSELETKKVASHFTDLSKKLTKVLPQSTTLLSIADTNTSGLTGEFKTSDLNELSKSNIYKLIYGINMNQEKGDAGGSWGLGKTSFFRIGVGIVVYYSRVKLKNGKYEDRLAACLIEDSSKENALMPDNPRGIAWWGDKDGLLNNRKTKTFPITDTKKIKKILSDFDVKLYEGDQTGTNIIIPFINNEEVVYQSDDDKLNDEVYWWEKSFEESIKMSIKRWYLPRLYNKDYTEKFNQPFLTCVVNGDLLTNNEGEITFNYFKELYNAALTNEADSKDIFIKDIKLKQMGMYSNEIPTGRVAYKKVSFSELGLINGSNLSPLAILGVRNSNRTDTAKILAYSRKPGMVVEYAIDDNEWMNGVHIGEDEFVFAFFVPNSDGKLHEKYQPQYKTLENYLRETEQADHANWHDINLGKYKVTIIKRLKKEVAKAISSDFGESIESISSKRTSTLSRKFGQLFLPKKGFGKTGNKPTKKSTDSKKNSTGRMNATVDIVNVQKEQLENTLKITANLNVPKSSKYYLTTNVATVDTNMDKNKWEKTFGDNVKYPFEITHLNLVDEETLGVLKDNGEYIVENESSKNSSTTIELNLLINDETMQPILTLKKLK